MAPLLALLAAMDTEGRCWFALTDGYEANLFSRSRSISLATFRQVCPVGRWLAEAESLGATLWVT